MITEIPARSTPRQYMLRLRTRHYLAPAIATHLAGSRVAFTYGLDGEFVNISAVWRSPSENSIAVLQEVTFLQIQGIFPQELEAAAWPML